MPRRPLSLALRLTLFFGVAAAIVFPVFGWVISRSMENHFAEGDTAELEVIASAAQTLLSAAQSDADSTVLQTRFDDILVGHHSAALRIVREDGRVIFSSAKPDLSSLTPGVDGGLEGNMVRQWADQGHSYRVLTQRVESAHAGTSWPYSIAVAVATDYHLHFLDSFQRTLWILIASSVALMSAMGWIAVRQGHAPLRDIVGRIRQTSASKLNTRLVPEGVPRELGDLVASFNEMLGRVDRAFQQLSNFNADIAHELRTPITNLMTQTQVALSKVRTVEEYREILYSNMEEYDRMAQMVGDMLFLGQADHGPLKKDLANLNLAEEIRALFDYYEGWAEERGVELQLEGTATVAADRSMLQRALGNLISNAIRHTPAGRAVQVTLDGTRESEISIAIENPGAPIPAEHLPKLFDRFYRVDPSRQRGDEGAGLGLAIVKSIIDAHGGHVDVVSTATRTRFQITLPRPS